jgi:hypothetical protein
MASEPMQLWEFYEAPEELRALSTHGGDEDGILVVPRGVNIPYWIERLWGPVNDPVEPIELPDGRRVYIWTH